VKLRTELRVCVEILVEVPVVVIYAMSLFREVRIRYSKLGGLFKELV